MARDDIPKSVIEKLEKVGAVQSVYRRVQTHRARAGIRMQSTTLPGERALRQALSSTTIHADIIDETEERFVVRPKSGRGDDAINLANEVAEKARPGMSSARMLQVVERPDIHRK